MLTTNTVSFLSDDNLKLNVFLVQSTPDTPAEVEKTSAPICPNTQYPNFRRYTRSKLCFVKYEAKVQKPALPFVPARNIRASDVISEVTGKERKIE